MLAEVIVRMFRGELVESIHYGHIAVVDHQGHTLYYLGNPQLLTYARSSAKLLQAIPIVELEAAERFGLAEQEIAIICASHNGEAEHVETVRSIFYKIGLDPALLQCGSHEPLYQPYAELLRKRGESPTPLHNNCSGKHAGMLVLAKALNVSLEHYMSPQHPVQQLMLNTVSEMSKTRKADILMGVDGCGVPVFGLTLNKLALAYARIGHSAELSPNRARACEHILRSVVRHPHLLAGTDRFDTKLIETTNGRIIGKMGAEGVFAITLPEKGWGIAFKVEDGSLRALYPTVMETLSQLSLLSEKEQAELFNFRHPLQRNWQGTVVGSVQPSFTLHANE